MHAKFIIAETGDPNKYALVRDDGGGRGVIVDVGPVGALELLRDVILERLARVGRLGGPVN